MDIPDDMQPASDEEKDRKYKALINLRDALDEFGLAWESSFTKQQRELNIHMTQNIGPAMAKLYIHFPVNATFVLSAILIEQIENAMSNLV